MIDIIVPVYNQEKVVEKLLQSLSIQSFKYFKVIIGDDNSIDGTLRKIKESTFIKNMNVEIIENKKNLGVTKNVNNLLRHSLKSDSEYILFTAGDDFLDSKILELKMKALEENKEAIMVGSKTLIVNNKNQIIDELHQKFIYDQKGNLNWIKYGNIWGNGGLLWRKSMIKFYFDERIKIASDFLFVTKNISNHGVLFIDKPLYFYRKSQNSVTLNKNTKHKVFIDVIKSHMILIFESEANTLNAIYGLFNAISKKIFNKFFYERKFLKKIM